MTKKRPTDQYMSVKELPKDLTNQLEQRLLSLRSSVKTDYLKSEVMSKFVSKDTAYDSSSRRNRAIFKWLCTERENEATNDRLLIMPQDYQILPGVTLDQFVTFARNLIVGVIGDTPPVDALIGTFSGGASTSRPRARSFPASKYVGKAHVTQRCLESFLELVPELPGWLRAETDLNIEVVPGNVLFTVPKKTDIDRCACKEPDLNMFIQKGIGSFFRRCLLRTGVNLNDQSINRSLAREGSVTGRLATLDLSSASDSVTEGLVSLFLPVTWYTLLDAVRCQVTIIDGEEHRNHMFSSMGNGFTFELESLLFYALTRTTAYFRGIRGVVSVYGDDIICPAELTPHLTWVLNFFGFQINSDKSFSSGPFRESCGGHYWNGLDITPFYIKEPITQMTQLIDVANKLRQWAVIDGIGILDPEVEEIWLWLKSFIPNVLWGGGDTSFIYQLVSYDTPSARLVEETKRVRTGNGGYYQWLNATMGRTAPGDGIQTSVRTISLNRLRLRAVRSQTVPRLPALFSHELS